MSASLSICNQTITQQKSRLEAGPSHPRPLLEMTDEDFKKDKALYYISLPGDIIKTLKENIYYTKNTR